VVGGASKCGVHIASRVPAHNLSLVCLGPCGGKWEAARLPAAVGCREMVLPERWASCQCIAGTKSVVLPPCLPAGDPEQPRSFLLVLDAGSMREVGRATIPPGLLVPFGFHGNFFPTGNTAPGSQLD